MLFEISLFLIILTDLRGSIANTSKSGYLSNNLRLVLGIYFAYEYRA